MPGLSKINRFFTGSFLFRTLLIPLSLLFIYCYSFAFISSRFLIKGVNYDLTSRLGGHLLILLALVSLLVIFLRLIRKNERSQFKINNERVSLRHLPLLLLPLTPVAQYLLNNQEILSFADVVAVTVFFILFSSIYIFAIPALMSKFSSTQLLMSLGLAFVFVLIDMPVLSQNFDWFGNGSLKIQLAYLGFVFVLTWIMLAINNQKFLYIILIIYFVSNSVLQFISNESKAERPTLLAVENELLSMTGGRSPGSTPNIYLLVYDAYVPNETMLAYGIDNSSQEKYLQDKGFMLYPSVYSVDAETLNTMSRVLNASTEYGGNTRKAVSGDGNVQNTLRSLGYKTYGLFPHDYLFLGVGSSYDFSIPGSPERTSELIISAALIGEFRWDIGFHSLSHEEYVDQKQEFFRNINERPIFIYTHSDNPGHSQNSGVCLHDETDLFQERLILANHEIQQDIAIITKLDPEAIVIVAGDHGPYLTKNCLGGGTSDDYDISEISRLDIQDRFGTFLAIKWPSTDYKNYDDITVLQDLFPAIFAYLYQDMSFLELKINPEIIGTSRISGVSVKDGTIIGGINNGDQLYISNKRN